MARRVLHAGRSSRSTVPRRSAYARTWEHAGIACTAELRRSARVSFERCGKEQMYFRVCRVRDALWFSAALEHPAVTSCANEFMHSPSVHLMPLRSACAHLASIVRSHAAMTRSLHFGSWASFREALVEKRAFIGTDWLAWQARWARAPHSEDAPHAEERITLCC